MSYFDACSDFLESELANYATQSFINISDFEISDSFIDYCLYNIVYKGMLDNDVYYDLTALVFSSYVDENYLNCSSKINNFFDGLKDDLMIYLESLSKKVIFDLPAQIMEMKQNHKDAENV